MPSGKAHLPWLQFAGNWQRNTGLVRKQLTSNCVAGLGWIFLLAQHSSPDTSGWDGYRGEELKGPTLGQVKQEGGNPCPTPPIVCSKKLHPALTLPYPSLPYPTPPCSVLGLCAKQCSRVCFVVRWVGGHDQMMKKVGKGVKTPETVMSRPQNLR